MYPLKRFDGIDGDMLVHPCRLWTVEKDAVEFHTPRGCVLSQESFEGMVEWVRSQFAILEKQGPRTIH